MPIVSATANVAGESLEQVTSKLAVLSDNSVDASTAATSLRNIYIDLAKEGLELDEAFDLINNSTNKLETAFDLFGKQSAGVAIILAENQEKTAALEDQFNSAAGSAESFANEQLDTLEGKTLLLGSAWDGLKKSIEDGEGVFISIKEGAIELLTDAITFITDIVNTLTASFKK